MTSPGGGPWRTGLACRGPLCPRNALDWTSPTIYPPRSTTATSITSQELRSCSQVGGSGLGGFLEGMKREVFWRGKSVRERWRLRAHCSTPIFTALAAPRGLGLARAHFLVGFHGPVCAGGRPVAPGDGRPRGDQYARVSPQRAPPRGSDAPKEGVGVPLPP